MKKPYLLVVLLITLLSVGTVVQPAAAQGVQSQALAAKDAYQFPVRPGSAEWRAFTSHAEMLAATQIPDHVLKQISTEGLIETVLTYPLLSDIFAFNSTQEGFDAVKSRFNGLQALLARHDAGRKLLSRYREMDPATVTQAASSTMQGNIAIEFVYVETLLAQPEIMSQMSAQEQRVLLSETLKKGQQKQNAADVYGILSQEATTLVMGKALNQVDPKAVTELSRNEAVKAFLESGFMVRDDLSTLNNIVTQAQKTLNQKVAPYVALEGDVSTSDYNGTVTTPKGSSVSVIVRTYELSQAEIDSINAQIGTSYPNASRERNASRKYNCHSYAWYSQSTSNDRWMNSPGDDKYWTDGSYIADRYDAPDYRVSYASDDHSAIVAYSPTGPYLYRSKWGTAGLYRHVPGYDPYNADTLNRYKRNF
jgi:hypothetical protein